MEAEAEARLLLQEARESIEAARSYRRELRHRLGGLQQARQQVRGRGGGGAAAGRAGTDRALPSRALPAGTGAGRGTERAGPALPQGCPAGRGQRPGARLLQSYRHPGALPPAPR